MRNTKYGRLKQNSLNGKETVGNTMRHVYIPAFLLNAKGNDKTFIF